MDLQNGYIVTSGYKINYITGGQGFPVVLFPGWPSNFKANDSTLNILKHHFTVYAINLPGFGCSDAVKPKPTLENLTELFAKLFTKLGIREFSLVGLSFGGLLALNYAAFHPSQVKNLLLVAPPVKYDWIPNRMKRFLHLINIIDKIPGLFSLLQVTVNSNIIFPLLYALVTRYHYDGDGKTDFENNRAGLKIMNFQDNLDMFNLVRGLDLTPILSRITARTLVLYGTNDSFVGDSPIKINQYRPNSALIQLPAEHWNILSKYPDHQIIAFLSH